MLTTMNITASFYDLERFENKHILKQFYAEKGLDGLELLLCGAEKIPEIFTVEDILGIHLKFYSSWYDFWREDKEALQKEYGDSKIWIEQYGGTDPEDLLKRWSQELEMAHEVGVHYVVFHVSECVLQECMTYQFLHSDQEVCDAACEIINRLLQDKPYEFDFLVENLWWSGLNLKDPEVTGRLMEKIQYKHKGIMLDTGHLMHTNNEIKNQEEAVQYIHEVLDRHGELCRYIKGIHLNQSLSGEYVKNFLKMGRKLEGDYGKRLQQIYPHIFQIDSHQPFTTPGVLGLIERIKPEYLTYELISRDLKEHEEMLLEQLKIWD